MSSVQSIAGEIKNRLGLWVVAGNITTYEQAETYKKLGVDIARVGVGGGSSCTTRLKTGVGFPQLSAIFETTETGIYVIADGGIKQPADLSKAIAAGAKMGMIGGMFAGTEETPGEVINGEKIFRGQASTSYMKDNQVVKNGHRTDEGIAISVPAKGTVVHVVDDLIGGLKSAMSYTGARNIDEFQERSKFVKISPSTVYENKPHIQNKS
jgi:IMP dehydrogenase